MKVLVSAFSCGSGWSSEPGVGWSTVEQISRRHEVWVLVEAGWKKRMADRFDPAAHPRIHFVWVRIPWLDRLVDGGLLDNGAGWLAYYTLWQWAALLEARRLHREVGFNLVHHVTFVKYSVASHLHRLGLPFIFGPVGGAEDAPSDDFFRGCSTKALLAEKLRRLHMRLARHDPWLRSCVKQARLCLGTTRQSAEELRVLGARDVRVLPAISLPDEDAHSLAAIPRGDTSHPPLLLFVGRLLAWKGVHLGLMALARSSAPGLRLRIIGDGPARSELEALSQRLGLSDRVEFAGSLPRQAVLEALALADGLLFPSLHDSGGYAVIEAMAAGLPVICLDLGGPGLFMAPDCGWSIQAQSQTQTVEDLAQALDAFAASPARRTECGLNARRHCLAHFTASAHGDQIETLHQVVTAPATARSAR